MIKRRRKNKKEETERMGGSGKGGRIKEKK